MLAPKLARRLLALTLTLAPLIVAAPVRAAESAPPRYAVLSLIGDRMTVVWFRQPTASNLDRNEQQDVTTRDAALDNTALIAVDDAIKRVQPNAPTVLLASTDAALYKMQGRLLDAPGESAAMLETVKAMVSKTGATRLILVTKYRAEAHLLSRDGYLGTGKLTGLGFYVDQERVTSHADTGVEDVGFIAPYAYLAVSLIDTSTMTTLRKSVVTEAQVVSTARSKNALRPWDALTPKQKLESLEEAVRKAIDRAVPEVLAGS